MNKESVNGLILRPGLFFHSFNSTAHIEWQGFIRSQNEDGRFKLQLFSWVDGGWGDQAFATADEMSNWRFFQTCAAMRDAGNRLIDMQGEQRRKQHLRQSKINRWLLETGQLARPRKPAATELPPIVTGTDLMRQQGYDHGG